MEQRMVLDLYRFTQKLEENLEVILQQQYIKFFLFFLMSFSTFNSIFKLPIGRSRLIVFSN